MDTARIIVDPTAPSPLEIEHIRFHEGAAALLGLRDFAVEGLPRDGQPPIFEATIEVSLLGFTANDAGQIERTYRWQVVDGNNGPRAVALWRRPDGGWSLVRRIETCAHLLGLTPAEARP